jgi:hypothetical protein
LTAGGGAPNAGGFGGPGGAADAGNDGGPADAGGLGGIGGADGAAAGGGAGATGADALFARASAAAAIEAAMPPPALLAGPGALPVGVASFFLPTSGDDLSTVTVFFSAFLPKP